MPITHITHLDSAPTAALYDSRTYAEDPEVGKLLRSAASGNDTEGWITAFHRDRLINAMHVMARRPHYIIARSILDSAAQLIGQLRAGLETQADIVESARGGVAIVFSSTNQESFAEIEILPSGAIILGMDDGVTAPRITELDGDVKKHVRALAQIRQFIS